MSPNANPVIAALISALGDGAVLTGADIPEKARSDYSGSGENLPLALLRPASVDAVSAALRICNDHRQPIVPQGGMTGLAGGANPRHDDIALSLDRLAGIEAIDAEAGTMTVLAGTLLETAQKAAEDQGFLLPIDLGSRGSCQIGGNLATNAGGIRVISHGMTRDNVLGLEAVLADGTVISSMRPMLKNNTGYDLKQLFIGSEGTLGIITRAVLKLKPLPKGQETALVALASFADVLTLLRRARESLMGLSAFELMWAFFFRFSSAAEGLSFFREDHPFLVIVERSGEGAQIEDFLAAMFEEGLVQDAVIAQSEKQRRQFWTVREGLSLDALPGLVNFDVSLPIGVLDRFATAAIAALEQAFPGIHVSIFGHVADSNIHLCVSAGAADAEVLHRIEDITYGLVHDFSGSISAEHGIGLLKRDYLSYSRSPAELALMRRIKLALDPSGILNPGKVLG